MIQSLKINNPASWNPVLPNSVYDLIPLHHLPPGQSARIDQLLGNADQVHRLEELGLRRGSTVEMVRAGSPCIVRLAESKLCFRQCDVFQVLVRLGEPS